MEDLLDYLKAPEDWTRLQAKRVLKERGAKAVLPALAKWVDGLDATNAEYEHHLLEGLWTYESLNTVEPKLLAKLLQAHDHRARAAAVRVVGNWQDRLDHPLELLAARVLDDHPRVRLEAVRALGTVGSPRSVEIAMQALEKPVDRFLDYALWLTAHELEGQWLPALKEGKVTFGSNVRQLIFALQATDSRNALVPLVDLVKRGKVPAEGEESVLSVIAGLGGPAELTLVLDRVFVDKTSAATRTSLLNALVQATRERNVRPGGDVARVEAFLGNENESVRAAAARACRLLEG